MYTLYGQYHSQTRELTPLESSISLQQNQILLVIQAFASPPDMASSGVWENVIPPKPNQAEPKTR